MSKEELDAAFRRAEQQLDALRTRRTSGAVYVVAACVGAALGLLTQWL